MAVVAARIKTMGARGSTMLQPGEGATILTEYLFRLARRGGYHPHRVTLAHLDPCTWKKRLPPCGELATQLPGLDWSGLERLGLEWIGLKWSEMDEARWAGLDWTGGGIGLECIGLG